MKKAIYDSKVEGGFSVNKRNSERVNPFHEKLPILVQWSVGLRCLISTGIFFFHFLFFLSINISIKHCIDMQDPILLMV